MLTEVLPKACHEHRALALLGGILDDFDEWLVRQGYRFFTRQCYVLRCTAIEKYLRGRGCRSLSVLTSETLQQCQRYFRQRPGDISHTVGCLRRFLHSEQLVAAPVGPPVKPFDEILAAYRQHLTDVRGFADSTVEHHHSTISEFLTYLYSGKRVVRARGADAPARGKICSLCRKAIQSALSSACDRARTWIPAISPHDRTRTRAP